MRTDHCDDYNPGCFWNYRAAAASLVRSTLFHPLKLPFNNSIHKNCHRDRSLWKIVSDFIPNRFFHSLTTDCWLQCRLRLPRISPISGLVTMLHACMHCRLEQQRLVALRQCTQLVIVIGDFHERESRARLITYH